MIGRTVRNSARADARHIRIGSWRAYGLAVSLVALLGSGLGSATSASASTAKAKVKSTAPSTFVIDQANSPATLDPQMQYDTDSYVVYRNIFDQLLRRDPKTLKIVPWIATSWKNTNPTTWVFQIRKGVKFSDGTALTASDVAFSINRIINPTLASPQFANFSVITGATASGSSVTVKTTTTSPTLLSYLTTLSIVPQQYVQRVGNQQFDLNPIGSGPYVLSKWVQGSSVLLVANRSYWAGKPQYSKVLYRTVPSDATRVADLESGAADLALELTPDDAVQLKASSAVKVIAQPTERVAYLAFNVLGASPTSSLAIRQAIAYGIDYKGIIASLEQGYAKPVKEVLSPTVFGYDTGISGYQYNPTKAKQLLASSGDPHPTLVFATSPAYPTILIQAIQAQLAAIGITVQIVSTDQATYLQKVQSPTHSWGSIRYGVWSCSCMDADGTLYPLFHTGTIWSSYSNPTFDAAVLAARSTLNAATRKSDYAAALKTLQSDVPAVGLFQYYAIDGVNKHIKWTPGPQETFFLPQIKWVG